jgi:hypothetical protein
MDPVTRVYVGNGSFGPYTYLWDKTPTRPLTLLLAEDPLHGNHRATVTTTLNINPDRSCNFTATLPPEILPANGGWWDGDRDFVAGAIADGAVAPTANAATLSWRFEQPNAITLNAAGNQDVYLPMYFSFAKSSGNMVISHFDTFGSIVVVKVKNDTPAPYTVSSLTDIWGDNFRSSGDASFANVTANEQILWTGDDIFTGPSFFTFAAFYDVNNCVIAPGTTDTLYFWLKDNLSPLTVHDSISVAVQNASGYGTYIKRPEPLIWEDNGFYALNLIVSCCDFPPTLQWAKSYGGSGTEMLQNMEATSDGGCIAVGQTTSPNDGNVSGNHFYKMGGPGGGSTYWRGDGWIVKLNNVGTIDWQRCYGGERSDFLYSVKPTPDGGYIAVGTAGPPAVLNFGNSSLPGNVLGSSDWWILKMDASGDVVWQKLYGGGFQGSSDNEVAVNVQPTSDGGYIVVGYTNADNGTGNVVDKKGDMDYWVLKLDENGNIEWNHCYGGVGYDEGWCIVETDSHDGYVVAGHAASQIDGNHGDFDYWVARLDLGGNVIWSKSYGGPKRDSFWDLQKTSDGGYILAGWVSGGGGDIIGYNGGGNDVWIVKIDGSGNLLWQRCLGGSGLEGQPTVIVCDDGYVVGALTSSTDKDLSGTTSFGGNNNDYWITKIDLSGTVKWAQRYGGSATDDTPYADQFRALRRGSDGSYFMAGYTTSTDGIVTGDNHGGADFWILKLGACPTP